MPTRRQDPEGRTFRQDAFASSTEYERGVLGNLVAARCQKLTDRAEIAMHWWLQQASWREGGLEQLAKEFLAANRAKIGTPTMHEHGLVDGRVCSAEQVRAIRLESHSLRVRSGFPLWGELAEQDEAASYLTPFCDLSAEARIAAFERSEKHPDEYPAKALIDALEAEALCELPNRLKQALVDPSASIPASMPWMPSFRETLDQWRRREAETALANFTETEVTRTVFEELDYALEARTFVLVEGREGIGKSEAARAWCAQHVGRAVYVALESGSGEETLFRSIARAVGTACSYGRKATEMRARLQDALQPGHMMLVLDESHMLWPQSDRSERTAPKRVEWLRTALIDFGVPVALVSTPQYFARACDRFRKGGWNANQIQRRLARTTALPEALSAEDAVAVARRYFPTLELRELKRAAGIALLTPGYLTTFRHVRERADFLGRRRPGVSEAELVKLALAEKAAEARLTQPAANAGPLPQGGAVAKTGGARTAPSPALQGHRMGHAEALPVPARSSLSGVQTNALLTAQ